MASILVIEDSPDFQNFLVVVLEAEHYSVRSTSLLREGRELARAVRPDLVMLDLTLPDGDGLDFFNDPDLRALHVVAMTSMTDDTIIDRLRALAVEYFIKPIKAKDLAALVKRLVGE